MSAYRERVGQRIGTLAVIADHGRTSAGKVLWECLDSSTGQSVYRRTESLIARDRQLSAEGSS